MIILTKFTSAADANYAKELLKNNNISCELRADTDSEEIDRIELILVDDHDLELAQGIMEDEMKYDE